MVFMCQQDSFLQQFETQVLSCELVKEKAELEANGIELNDKTVFDDVFRIICEDTILFPEGGGQPDDRGTINETEIIRVVRKGTQALHYISLPSKSSVEDSASAPNDNQTILPFKTGDKVITKLDWKRRFDHMQQHSGQHLITAVADTLFGFPTTSWWLGSEESYIELDTKDISENQLSTIENEVNSKIRAGIPVSVDVVELDDPKLANARGRNLPEDVKGQIRIVTMAGIESNVCCGTHLTNLSQLQVIKLLHVIKKKGKCLLHFLSGDRVINRFAQQFKREQQLTGILKTTPSDFPTAAEKLNIALKNARKSCQALAKDLVSHEAKQFSASGSAPKFWAYHRDNAELDFASSLLREIGPTDSVVLITTKTENTSGNMLLVAGNMDKEKLTSLGDSLCEILDGKGNLRGNVYQAKVNKINNVKKAVKFAKDFTNSEVNVEH